MNVSELYALTLWIDSEIVIKQISVKYNTLFQVLQQNSQANQQQPFETQKNDLISSIKSVALDRITKDQLAFLDKLGIAKVVGDTGVDAIEDILYKNVIDVATSAQKIQLTYQAIENGVARSNQIKSGLSGYVSEEEYEVQDQVLMRITFSGDAELSNVSQFKSWGSVWFDIGRGIAMVHGAAPEDVKVIGATKGSIVLELAVAYGIARTASLIILEALKVADRVIEIRKHAEELRTLQLHNDQISATIEKEADNEKKKGIENITATVIKDLKISKTKDGDKVTALDKAIQHLVGFVEKGGEVDFIIPDEDESVEEGDESDTAGNDVKQLRDAFSEIRKLEKKIALLEHK